MSHAVMLLALVLAATPFPEALTKPTLARLERFTFPSPSAFQTAWKQEPANGELIVRGTLKTPTASFTGWFLARQDPEGTHLVPIVLDVPREDGPGTWVATSSGADGWQVTRWGDTGTFQVAERLPTAMSEVDLIPRSYVDTLLTSAEPLYAADATDDPGLRKTVDSVKRGEERAWAEKNKGNDALFGRFSRFRPIGGCSMDTLPQETARLYSELAYARGDLAKFLQLQVNIMGDQFDRVAWSSFGEAAHSTEADRLLSTGVDADQFLLGLLISRPGERGALGPWRFARSVREAGRVEALIPELERLARSTSTDPYNRLRATQALLYLEESAPTVKAPAGRKGREALLAVRTAAVKRLLERLDLHPVARAWLERSAAD